MKTTAIGSVLALAVLMGTSAFAADKAPTSTKATDSYSSTSAEAKHPTQEQCKTQATAKKLNGKKRSEFMKSCEAGKATS
ncbi:MAG: PsiF family protein [Gammaproteobacteria bacterium]